jgi:D-threo-aldose 1-dehydrogenase
MSAISKTTLGTTGLQIPILGLGTAPISGLYHHIPDDVAIKTVQVAYNLGATLIDTAPLYGAGLAERIVGEAMVGIDRDSYILSTKIGRLINLEQESFEIDYSRDGVLRSLESSLKRLKTDRIDILHIHDPDNHPDEALEEAFPAMAELRSQGVVRAISAGMNQWEVLLRFAHYADFDCFLLAGRYTLLEQGALPFLDICAQKGIGVLLAGVFNSGILATGAVVGAKHNYRDAHPDILTHTEEIDAICRQHGAPLNAVAMQFAMAHPAVSSLVVGAASPEEVAANVAALHQPIEASLWQTLRQHDLIGDAAPTPDGVDPNAR